MHIDRQVNSIHTIYDGYSVDGKVFTNGFQYFDLDPKTEEVSYIAKVTIFGDDSGSMDFKLTFSKDNDLLKDKSYGYATYHEKTIKTDDMSK